MSRVIDNGRVNNGVNTTKLVKWGKVMTMMMDDDDDFNVIKTPTNTIQTHPILSPFPPIPLPITINPN